MVYATKEVTSKVVAVTTRIETSVSDNAGGVHAPVVAFARIDDEGKITLSKTIGGNSNGYQFNNSDPAIVEAIGHILIEAARISKLSTDKS